MNYEDWHEALAPKVTGTWNLYQATRGKNLEFCVMIGSIISICGNPGHSNYAAANSFLTLFPNYARSTGYPAAVIQLGAMADVGFVSESQELLRRMSHLSLHAMSEKELMKCLEVAIRQARLVRTVEGQQSMGSLIVGLRPLSDRQKLSSYRNDSRFSFYKTVAMQDDQEGSANLGLINEFLSEVTRDSSILDRPSSLDLLSQEIGRLVHAGEGSDESLEAASEIAIDSLMTIAIRSWLRKRIGVDVPTLQITKSRNVGGLVRLVIKVLKEKHDKESQTEKD